MPRCTPHISLQLPHQLAQDYRAAVVAFVDQVEGAWGVRFTPGYDPELRFMAHLWEPLRRAGAAFWYC